ncbi:MULTISPECIES: glycosyltransferase family 4 protein [unclassified Thioalkalivibrio]|uniref:glycosyltransferase n=1 Tax=unclassified Thioalkalivibrio TaxID=2621013 RepID=UPI0009DA98E9
MRSILQVVPALESGGVERGTLEIARAIHAAGHRSIVMSGGGRLVTSLESQGSEHITWPVGRKSLRSLRLVRPLRNFIRAQRIDLIHARSRVPAWIVWRALQGMRPDERPAFVTTFHGFYSPGRYSSVMTRGDGVIAVSNSISEYIRNNYPACPPECVHVIHRGVDPTEFPHGYTPTDDWKNTFLQSLPANARNQALITLPGRITRWKGQLDFIDVMDGLIREGHPVHGILVGGTEARRRRYELEIRREISERQLDSHITWLGQRSDLREIMSVSFAVLSLSRDPEAFGRVSLEALSLGRPVAAYAHGGVGEQMSALFPQGSVPPRHPKEAVRILSGWLTNAPPPTPAPLTRFTLQQMQQETLGVYASLLAPE